MNTLIQNLFDRVLPSSKIQFPCPVCGRELEIGRSDAGADLVCPHCNGRITAPSPSLGLGPQIRDEKLLAIRKYQETHARSLVDLKRGRFKATVLRKQKRARDDHEAALWPTPPDPSQPIPVPRPHPNAATKPVPATSAPAAERAPRKFEAPAPHRRDRPGSPVKGIPQENAARSFRPRDCVPIVTAKDSPTQWDEEPGASSREIGTLLSTKGKALWLLGGAAVLVLLGLLVRKELNTTSAQQERVFMQEKLKRQEDEGKKIALQAEEEEMAEPLAIARKALASPDWRDMLPHVRHPDRVRPLMEEYYDRHTWAPIHFTSSGASKFEELLGHRFLAVQTVDDSGRTLTIGLEKTSGGWKLDWELLVPLTSIQWQKFLEDRPLEKRAVRVNIIRRTPSPEMLMISGIPKDRAYGVMMWYSDMTTDNLYAVLDKNSAVAKDLADFLSVSRGKKLILDLSFVPVSQDLRKDMVAIHRVVEVGWTFMEEENSFRNPEAQTDALRNAFGFPAQEKTAAQAGQERWLPVTQRKSPLSN